MVLAVAGPQRHPARQRAPVLRHQHATPRCFSWFAGEKKQAVKSDDHKIYSLAELEKAHIQKVLDETGGPKIRAAQLLGIDRKTLYQKIKRYGIKM